MRTRIAGLVLLFASACAPAPKPVAVAKPTPAATPKAEVAFPDEPWRKTAPEPRAIKSFEQPTIARFTLSNGIQVFLVESHELPTVSMSLVFDGGAASD